MEINGELFVKLSDAAGYTNTVVNTTKGIAAYIKDGFYVVKRGEYIYIKGARSASALAEGIKGTRYAVKNVDKYVSVGKYVDAKIAQFGRIDDYFGDKIGITLENNKYFCIHIGCQSLMPAYTLTR